MVRASGASQWRVELTGRFDLKLCHTVPLMSISYVIAIWLVKLFNSIVASSRVWLSEMHSETEGANSQSGDTSLLALAI